MATKIYGNEGRETTENEINNAKMYVVNDEEIGPQIDITMPTIVEVKYNGSTLWINVDEVCRLRITKARDVRFDAPGLTQREVEG